MECLDYKLYGDRFAIGYLMIAFEHVTRINKATVALLMAIICWVLQFACLEPATQKIQPFRDPSG